MVVKLVQEHKIVFFCALMFHVSFMLHVMKIDAWPSHKSLDELCVSVIIPARYDVMRSYIRRMLVFLKTVSRYTPDEVIFVVSGSPHEKIVGGRFKFVYHMGKGNPARNRNMGGKLAKCPILSFFDIDDIPHPDRFGIVMRIFREYPSIDALLFPFDTGEFQSSEFFDRFIKSREIIDPEKMRCFVMKSCNSSGVGTTLYQSCYREHIRGDPNYELCCRQDYSRIAANGWLSVKTKLFLRFFYNEMLDIAEDGELNARMINAGHNLTIWDLKLGIYNAAHTLGS